VGEDDIAVMVDRAGFQFGAGRAEAEGVGAAAAGRLLPPVYESPYCRNRPNPSATFEKRASTGGGHNPLHPL